MVRLIDLSPDYAEELRRVDLPTFQSVPWVQPPPLRDLRVAIVSTAGLYQRGDPEFGRAPGEYRPIASAIDHGDVLMSHVSVNFDRSAYAQDLNVVFPLDHLEALARDGEIASVASWHYSFMGATDPARFEDTAREVARLLREDSVTAALLIPV